MGVDQKMSARLEGICQQGTKILANTIPEPIFCKKNNFNQSIHRHLQNLKKMQKIQWIKQYQNGLLAELPHKPQILRIVQPTGRRTKAPQVGQNAVQLSGRHTKPLGQRGGILIDRRAGQQSALANMPLVLRQRSIAAHTHWWRCAIKRPAPDCAADNKMVAAPAVVRAIAVGCQGAAKV